MPIGNKLTDRYEVKQTLGQGGMGVVYWAYDTLIRRDVALATAGWQTLRLSHHRLTTDVTGCRRDVLAVLVSRSPANVRLRFADGAETPVALTEIDTDTATIELQGPAPAP